MAGTDDPVLRRDVALVELVDRLIERGVVLTGDVTLAVAGVDLVRIDLRALVIAVETANRVDEHGARLEAGVA